MKKTKERKKESMIRINLKKKANNGITLIALVITIVLNACAWS